jgi:hypothetical protein
VTFEIDGPSDEKKSGDGANSAVIISTLAVIGHGFVEE